MHLKNTYAPARRGFNRRQMLRILRWPFLGAGLACAAVNLAVGGKAWSVIAGWGLYMVWSNVFALDMVDYNRVSQGVKMTLQVCLLLLGIDVLLAPGWAAFVLPIVGFGAVTALAALFFSDLRKQTANVMQLLLPTAAVLAACVIYGWSKDVWPWPVIVLTAVSSALIFACMAVFGTSLLESLRKYFHLK